MMEILIKRVKDYFDAVHWRPDGPSFVGLTVKLSLSEALDFSVV